MALLSRTAAYARAFLMVLTSDHISGATGITVTGSVGKGPGPWASFSGAVTELGGGWYIYTYSTGETNTTGDLRVQATGTSCDPTDFVDQVVDFNPGSNVNLGLTAVPAATAGTGSGLPTAAAGNVVGLNWSNLLSPSTAVSLSATDIRSVTQGIAVVTVGGNAISTASFASGTTLYGVTTVTTGLSVVNVAANAITSPSAATAFFNRIIDIAARRQYTNIRSSSDGETVVRWSLLGAVAKLVNKTDWSAAPVGIVYHEDGSTSFYTQTLTTTDTAGAVVVVS